MSLEARIEALLFASDRPLSTDDLVRLVGDSANVGPRHVDEALRLLREEHERRAGGFHIIEVAGGFEFRTRSKYAQDILKLYDRRPARLSPAAMETLAIIAYRQPVTKALIEELRGVDSSASIRTLLERELITMAGRSREPGRPHLYKTSREFLRVFGLAALRDLPNLREVEELNQGHLFRLGESASDADGLDTEPTGPADDEVVEQEAGT